MSNKPMPQPARGRDGKVVARNTDGSPVTFRMRVAFQKHGRAAMLSHLEVARALERVIRRAGLPYAITNGFSPHMRIAFGSALPVGVGGDCEYLDVLLTEKIDADQALASMQAASAPALMVLACEFIGNRDVAASAAFPYSTYIAYLDRPLEVSAADLKIPDSITVMRKKKEKVLNVCDFLQPGLSVEENKIRFVLKAGDNGSLRPDVLLREILKDMHDVRIQSITRVSQSESLE